MQIQILVPSQGQRRFLLQVEKTDTVAKLRNTIAQTIGVPEKGFLLIALGKIMLNQNADKTAATLSLTYRLRDQTSVFVHLIENCIPPSKVTTEVTHSKSVAVPRHNIIRDNNIVSTPFDGAQCSLCLNNKRLKKCQECGCAKCHYKTGDPLICDQCENYWHTHCAGLSRIPTDQYWFCPDCINEDGKLIVGKGEAVKDSTNQKSLIVIRDMDCVLVPVYHVGKIPGIYCGQSWENRSLVYDWGIHRASRANVTGTSLTGAVSIVLSKGLREDRDLGYEFVFSGVGGEIRTRKHSDFLNLVKDQTLTKYNKALAVTCNAPFNGETGAKAHNWRKSRPIRVCRAASRKHTHPTYAPTEGIRYDGLYKIVKYWPQKDKASGFIIWKFLFRRDDQEPPPWMSFAKEFMSTRGLRTIKIKEGSTTKLSRYVIPAHIQRLMEADTKNKRLWREISEMEFWSEYEFLHYLFDTATVCSSFVCSKPIKDPVTTPCGHICCVNCLTQSNTDTCFTCRTPLPKDSIQVNDKLKRILQSLNWAYDIENSTKPIRTTLSPSLDLDKNSENMVKQEVTEEYNNELMSVETEDYIECGIKQEYEYPTLTTSVQNTKRVKEKAKKAKKAKKVRIFIEYLGNVSAEQNKRRKLGN